MAKYTEAHLMSLSKRKLVKLLKKEGIEASNSQKKSELVRLLILAHKANTPSRTNRVKKRRISKRTKIAFLVVFLIVGSSVLLYQLSPVFNSNVQHLYKIASGQVEEDTTNDERFEDGPIIYEKGGKTYVVYNYPRPKVDVITDETCARPECELSSYYEQIKDSITPLAEFTEYDYTSRHAKGIIENYDVNLLPILIFDKTIEQTENFEQSGRFFKQVNDRYVLQLDPFKALKGPDLSSGQVLGNSIKDKAPLTIVEYTSFSCPHCVDAADNLEEILKIYEGNITIVIKYFSKGGNDMQAAIAAECASQQDAFLSYHDMLFEKQADWLSKNTDKLGRTFAKYATDLDLDKQEFLACYDDSQEIKDMIIKHTEEAESLAVDRLPTFFINNNIVQGAYPINSFSKIIDDILKEDGHSIQVNTPEPEKTEESNEESDENSEASEVKDDESGDTEADVETSTESDESINEESDESNS